MKSWFYLVSKSEMRRALIFFDCKTNFGEGSFRVFIFSVLACFFFFFSDGCIILWGPLQSPWWRASPIKMTGSSWVRIYFCVGLERLTLLIQKFRYKYVFTEVNRVAPSGARVYWQYRHTMWWYCQLHYLHINTIIICRVLWCRPTGYDELCHELDWLIITSTSLYFV